MKLKCFIENKPNYLDGAISLKKSYNFIYIKLQWYKDIVFPTLDKGILISTGT